MPEIVTCPSCGRETYQGVARCPHCGEVLDQKADKKLRVQEGLTRYGGFWLRAVALVIDEILVSLPFFMLFFAAFLFGFADSLFSSEVTTVSEEEIEVTYSLNTVGSIIYIVVYWLYEAFMVSSKYQATLGKHILGLRITDAEGKRLSFLRATGRHFARYVSWIVVFGILMVAFTKRKRGLHDFIANTVVVREA